MGNSTSTSSMQTCRCGLKSFKKTWADDMKIPPTPKGVLLRRVDEEWLNNILGVGVSKACSSNNMYTSNDVPSGWEIPEMTCSQISQTDLESNACDCGFNETEVVNETETERERKQQDVVATDKRRLEHLMMCKICLDVDASVVFLPCSHMVSCGVCAGRLQRCPLCRATIVEMLSINLQ